MPGIESESFYMQSKCCTDEPRPNRRITVICHVNILQIILRIVESNDYETNFRRIVFSITAQASEWKTGEKRRKKKTGTLHSHLTATIHKSPEGRLTTR